MFERKKELYKEKVLAGRKIYYIEIKTTKDGSKYLTINEVDPHNPIQSSRVMIFEDHLDDFREGIERAFKFFEPKKVPQYIQSIRQTHPRAYEKWSEEEDESLQEKYSEGMNVTELAKYFQRQKGAIRSRLKKLNLQSEE